MTGPGAIRPLQGLHMHVAKASGTFAERVRAIWFPSRISALFVEDRRARRRPIPLFQNQNLSMYSTYDTSPSG